MASRTIGAIALLLGSFAPALAQGPMTPMTLSTSTSTADTATTAAPAIPPPPIPPAPGSLSGKANPAGKIAKARPAKEADMAKEADGASDDGTVEKPVGDAVDAVNGDKKKRQSQVDGASSAPPRVDADHMAGMLNRMQLNAGGYGSARPDHGPVPLRAGE